MKYSAFALAALAVAEMASAQAKWVPLNSKEAQQAQGRAIETPKTPAPSAIAVPPPVAPTNPTETMTVSPAPRPQASAAPVTDGSRPLQITCLGAGTANKLAVASGWSSGSFSGFAGTTMISGTTSGTTTVYGTRQQGFGDQVDIRLFGGDDRIRMPRTMLPLIRGGKEGWFKLKNVAADARAIHATVAVNFINNPRVYIDRVTGTISISGKAGDYAGTCEAIDASLPARF